MISYSKQVIDSKEIRAVSKVLKSEYLTQGPLVKKFEEKISNYCNSKHAIAVNSATSGLHIACMTLGVKKNDIVWTSAISFVASANAAVYCSADIDFLDISLEDYNIDIKSLEKKLIVAKRKNKLPKVIIVVHFAGNPCQMKEIYLLKKKYKFKIMEDNCESLGSSTKSKKLGTFGLASSHSLYYGHHISTIEGGLVSTNNRDLYNIFLAIRAHGWARDMEENYKKKLEKKYKIDEFDSLYTFYYSGFNIRSTDLNATIGINQLKKINKISNIRNRNFYYYKKNLQQFWSQNSQLDLLSSFGYATFIKNRTEVFKYLKSHKIQSRPLICGNMGQQPFYKKKFTNQKLLKNASFVNKYGIYLPNHASLEPKNLDYIIKHFKSFAKPIFFKS